MISKLPFGRTEHKSSRIIFGAWALSEATQKEADRILELLLEYGVNHIDTAPMYRNAEECIGPWMEKYRDDFFIATKTYRRTYKGAKDNLRGSLKRLQVDSMDLWQLHNLTGPAGWKRAMEPDGALQALIEAHENRTASYLGVTGHGVNAPAMHIRSLERFDFDAVLLPYNYSMMKKPKYAANFDSLMRLCRTRGVAVQTIKSIARQRWGDRPKTHNTYHHEPLVDQSAIDIAVHWAMGLSDSFVISAGDMHVLPKVLEAASRFEEQSLDPEMTSTAEKFAIKPIFS